MLGYPQVMILLVQCTYQKNLNLRTLKNNFNNNNDDDDYDMMIIAVVICSNNYHCIMCVHTCVKKN